MIFTHSKLTANLISSISANAFVNLRALIFLFVCDDEAHFLRFDLTIVNAQRLEAELHQCDSNRCFQRSQQPDHPRSLQEPADVHPRGHVYRASFGRWTVSVGFD